MVVLFSPTAGVNPYVFDDLAATSAPPPPCTGDLNGDQTVNTQDLTILLGSFGQAVPPGTSGDLTGDGLVATPDLAVLLGAFGHPCP